MMEIPLFRSEDEEREFWATHDSVEFLKGVEPVSLEYVRNKSGATPSNWQFVEEHFPERGE